VLALGEMRELGALSAQLHREVGEFAAEQRPALLVAIGGDAKLTADVAAARGVPTEFAVDSAAAAETLLARLPSPAVVLVKASRGVKAEQVVDRLTQAKGRAA
jgi:UDP-N-acetylmuramoyl-tripeptide--D-alanyl-D-alanine ligase